MKPARYACAVAALLVAGAVAAPARAQVEWDLLFEGETTGPTGAAPAPARPAPPPEARPARPPAPQPAAPVAAPEKPRARKRKKVAKPRRKAPARPAWVLADWQRERNLEREFPSLDRETPLLLDAEGRPVQVAAPLPKGAVGSEEEVGLPDAGAVGEEAAAAAEVAPSEKVALAEEADIVLPDAGEVVGGAAGPAPGGVAPVPPPPQVAAAEELPGEAPVSGEVAAELPGIEEEVPPPAMPETAVAEVAPEELPPSVPIPPAAAAGEMYEPTAEPPAQPEMQVAAIPQGPAAMESAPAEALQPGTAAEEWVPAEEAAGEGIGASPPVEPEAIPVEELLPEEVVGAIPAEEAPETAAVESGLAPAGPTAEEEAPAELLPGEVAAVPPPEPEAIPVEELLPETVEPPAAPEPEAGTVEPGFGEAVAPQAGASGAGEEIGEGAAERPAPGEVAAVPLPEPEAIPVEELLPETVEPPAAPEPEAGTVEPGFGEPVAPQAGASGAGEEVGERAAERPAPGEVAAVPPEPEAIPVEELLPETVEPPAAPEPEAIPVEELLAAEAPSPAEAVAPVAGEEIAAPPPAEAAAEAAPPESARVAAGRAAGEPLAGGAAGELEAEFAPSEPEAAAAAAEPIEVAAVPHARGEGGAAAEQPAVQEQRPAVEAVSPEVAAAPPAVEAPVAAAVPQEAAPEAAVPGKAEAGELAVAALVPRQPPAQPQPPEETAAVAPAGGDVLGRYGLSEGDVVDAGNYRKYEELLTPGQVWGVLQGWRMKVVQPRRIELPAVYREATEKYAGQVRLSADGTRLLNYVAGQPFPHIDPNDPQVAQKIMWNFYYNYFPTDDLTEQWFETDTGTVGPRQAIDVERHFLFDNYRKLMYNGRVAVDPKPELPNPQGVRFKEAFYPAREPVDLKGLGALFHRYLDPSKPDDSWVYIPQLRRVRRLSTAQRSDALFGQDTDADAFGGYNGHIAWMKYRFLGERTILGTVHARNFPAKWQEPEDWLWDDVWEPRKVWVVEARSTVPQYAYSKRVLYIDQEGWVILISDSYDRAGQLWRSSCQMWAFKREAYPGARLASYEDEWPFLHAVVIFDSQLQHATATSLPSKHSKGVEGIILNRGAAAGVTPDYFTIASLIEAGS